MDDHLLNRTPPRLQGSQCRTQEHTSTNSVRIFLVGELSSAGKAFYQVFLNAGAGVSLIPFNGKDANQALDSIAKEFPCPSPALMVSASDAAWAALRVLNIWHLDTGVFQPAATSSSPQIPFAIPLPHIQRDTLFDLFAANLILDTGWVAQTISALACANRNVLDPDMVKRAILHYVAASERHGLHLAPKATTHGRNDAIAAIRIIQGAALHQFLTPEAAKECCRKICGIGGYFTETPNWDTLPFFQSLTQFRAASVPERPLFASILVVDDEGFWRNPMEPIWNQLGFALTSQQHPTEVSVIIEALQAGNTPVRAVLLDMELYADSLGGAKLLQVLHRRFPSLPVIALSVDDQFSETVLLKRMGAFAYVNKHALAEPRAGRDALSSFRQVKEAVVVAAFASLSAELTSLADVLSNASSRMIEQQKVPTLARHKPQVQEAKDPEALLSALDTQIRESLFVYVEECRRIFHGYWQDSSYPCGTACRQIIRALGLINDQWSSLWRIWRFDPDGYYRKGRYCRKPCLKAWLQVGDLRFPFWPYHEITTAIRDAASHAVIADSDFTWSDVWIAFLSLFLKMEGTCRKYYAIAFPSHAPEFARTCDSILHRTVVALQGLRIGSGSGDCCVTPPNQAKTAISKAAAEIQRLLAIVGDAEPQERSRVWLSLRPYNRAFRPTHELMCGFLDKCGSGLNLSHDQLSAAVLLLNLISQRLSQNADRIHRSRLL